jgi:hypothetical protein
MKRRILPVLVVLAALAGCARRDSANATPETAATPPSTAEPAPESTPPAASTEPAPSEAAPGEPPPAEQPLAEAPAPEDEACNPEPAQQFVGQVYTPELGEQARLATGARVERALRPGQIVAMEFRFDRLSFTLDEKGRVASVTCG